MFTSKSIAGIGRFIQLGSTMSVLPLKWNPKSHRLEIGSLKQRAVAVLITIYLYWEAAYQAHRVVTGRRNKSVPLTEYMKLVELFATRLTALLLQTIAFIYQEDVKYFGNQLLNMNARFMKIYGHSHRDPCVKTFALWYWFVLIHPAVTALVYAGDNKAGRYWHGALLPAGIQPYCIPLFILVEYWISLFSELGCAYLGSFVVAYYRATPVWTNELGRMASNSKTKRGQVVTLYRGLQILNRGYNNAYSMITACGVLALLADLTITLFCSLRVSPAIGLPTGLHFPMASLALVLVIESAVRPAGNLTSPSSEFLARFSSIVSGKRSCGIRRGHVKNMEKERKKAMKIKGRDDVQSEKRLDSSVPPERKSDGMRKDGSYWRRSMAAVVPSESHYLASQISIRKQAGAKENDIYAIMTAEVNSGAATSKRTQSTELTATAKSLYPLVVNCFIFFQFERSTIFDFYSTVLDQTISALLVT